MVDRARLPARPPTASPQARGGEVATRPFGSDAPARLGFGSRVAGSRVLRGDLAAEAALVQVAAEPGAGGSWHPEGELPKMLAGL